MKPLKTIFCIITAICLFLILLINAVDYSVYYRPQFYEETFAKYNVTEDARMEMEEILKLSDYLIDYLKGNEESLENYRAVVNGEERLFYSKREILHMEDVKVLFQGGLIIRRVCVIITILLILVMIIKKMDFLKTLAKSIIGTFLTILGILGVLTAVIASDFNKAFTTFHEIFFSNDLWLLNPNEDWVIRLLPEGFFMDMVIVIGVVFAVSLLAVLAICVVGLCLAHNQKHHN